MPQIRRIAPPFPAAVNCGACAPGAPSPPHLFEHAAALGPEGRNQTYRVAIRAAQYEALNSPHVAPALPAPSEPPQRQLEGPAVEEAA